MKTYFGYVRVSTQRQGTQGSSLQEQRSAIEAYASKSGLPISGWYEERETAAKQGRPIFRQMMRALKKGQANGIVIHKIDRSARNLHDWLDLIEGIDDGIEVHLAHDSLDLNSRGGRLSADIQAVVAADFIRNLREETRKGFYGRLKQGIYPLRAPIGYLDTGKGQPKSIDPEKGPLIRMAFDHYATGDYSFETLLEELKGCGLRGWRGAQLSKNGLTTILNNPFYYGLIHIRRTNEMFQGMHEPLIAKSLYDRVQRVLRGGRAHAGAKREFLFRRAVTCSLCGRSLIGERQKAKYVYYRCHQPRHAQIKEEVIEAAVIADLAMLTLTEEDVRDLKDLAEEHAESAADQMPDRESGLKLSLARVEERLSRLTDALVDGLIDRAAFDERKARALNDRAAFNEQVARLPTTGLTTDAVSDYVELANSAYLQYAEGDAFQKRDILKKLMSNLVVTGKSPVFTLPKPFQMVVEYRKMNECDLYRDEPRTFWSKVFDALVEEVNEKERREAAANDLQQRPRSPQRPWYAKDNEDGRSLAA